jgi:hypothetical protein
MELKLPLGITINKGSWKGRVTYIVRSESLGELESIVVRGIDDTSTALDCYAVGEMNDPMTAERLELLQPIAGQMLSALQAAMGRPSVSNPVTPHAVHAGTYAYETKYFECDHCE